MARLVQDDIANSFRRVNRDARDIAREVSGARDAAVLRKTFHAIFADDASPTVAAARARLPEDASAAAPKARKLVASVLPRMRSIARAIASWAPTHEGLLAGCARWRAKGKTEPRRARRRPQ